MPTRSIKRKPADAEDRTTKGNFARRFLLITILVPLALGSFFAGTALAAIYRTNGNPVVYRHNNGPYCYRGNAELYSRTSSLTAVSDATSLQNAPSCDISSPAPADYIRSKVYVLHGDGSYCNEGPLDSNTSNSDDRATSSVLAVCRNGQVYTRGTWAVKYDGVFVQRQGNSPTAPFPGTG